MKKVPAPNTGRPPSTGDAQDRRRPENRRMDGRYDVVVIGAGPAGEAAVDTLTLLHPDVLQHMRLPSAAHRISAGRRAQP